MTSDHERLFLENLETIEGITAAICRRNCCQEDEAEEFASWAKVKLIDNDYRVLRKFKGKSTLKTYLTTVLHNLFRDYRVHEWGRWRPSAKAKRFGQVGIQLETLTMRDHYSTDEAVEILVTNYHVETDREELEEMAAELPARMQRRFEGEEKLSHVGIDGGTEAKVTDVDYSAATNHLEHQLSSALSTLEPEDRLLLKMRYEDSFTVAQIANVMNLEPRPLYKRFERCLARLKRELESRNVSATDAMEVVGWERFELNIDFTGTERGNS